MNQELNSRKNTTQAKKRTYEYIQRTEEGKIKITEIKKTQNTTIGQSDRNQKSAGGNLTGDA